MNICDLGSRLLMVLLVGALVSSVSSCVPLAIGAAGGYILNNQGYRVQSPLTKKPKYDEPTYQMPVNPEPLEYTEY